MTKEMYTFEDKGALADAPARGHGAGGARLAGRTRRTCRSPFKAYYVEHRMFRYGRPQAGRLREFRQFGVEIIGAAGPRGRRRGDRDRGAATCASGGSTQLTLQLNSIGDEVCRPAYREDARRVPRGERDAARRGLPDATARATRCACSTARSTAGRTSCSRRPHLRASLRAVRRALRGGPAAVWTSRASPTCSTRRLVRGLDYYTRTAFEFVSDALSRPAVDAVRRRPLRRAGRGCSAGQPTPGVGFGHGAGPGGARDGAGGGRRTPRPRRSRLRRSAIGDDSREAAGRRSSASCATPASLRPRRSRSGR